MKKGLKIAGIVLGSLIGLLLLALLVVVLFGGPIAKVVVEKHSPDWVGRQITLGNARINPFAGAVTLCDVHMLEQDGQTDFVSFDTLYAQIDLFRLPKKEAYLKHIWLTGLDAQIINRGKDFNFQDIIDHFSSDDEVEEDTDTTSSPWGVGLYDIRIKESTVSYVDRPRGGQWAVENICIDVPGLYFGKDKTQAGLTLDFPDNQGSLELDAHYDMERNSFALDLDLDKVCADMAMPFVQDYLNVSKLGSRLSGCIRAYGNLDHIADLCLSGQLTVDGTDIESLSGGSLLSLDHLAVDVDTIDLGKMNIHLSSVRLSGITTTFENWADRNTFSGLLADGEPKTEEAAGVEKKSEENSSDETASEKPSLLLRVDDASVEGIHLTYTDHTLHRPFSYEVKNASVHAKNVTLSGNNDVTLAAELPGGGSVAASWQGGMNLKQDDEVLKVTAKNIQMKDFSPWVEYYTASPLEGGSLSLVSENRLHSGMLNGTNKVDIFGLKAGKKLDMEADYKAVPMKLAIGVLEDMNHKIAISLPVSGDINSPKFSYSKIIWKTLGNVMVKAVASPWVALGNALGLGGEDLSTLPIDVLQPEFTSEQYASLDKLVEMMRSQDELTLSMKQSFCLADAIEQQGLFELKKAYYLQQNNRKDGVSLADIENIRELKSTDKNLLAFAEQLTGVTGTLKEQAAAYYKTDSLKTEVMRAAENRNRILVNYLVNQQKLPADRVSVSTLTAEELAAYRGKDRYDVSSGAGDAFAEELEQQP